MSLPDWLSRDRVAVLVALLAPLAVSAVLVPFRDSFANTDAALLLVLVVVAVAAPNRDPTLIRHDPTLIRPDPTVVALVGLPTASR